MDSGIDIFINAKELSKVECRGTKNVSCFHKRIYLRFTALICSSNNNNAKGKKELGDDFYANS